jgi:hypothetical protein
MSKWLLALLIVLKSLGDIRYTSSPMVLFFNLYLVRPLVVNRTGFDFRIFREFQNSAEIKILLRHRNELSGGWDLLRRHAT